MMQDVQAELALRGFNPGWTFDLGPDWPLGLHWLNLPKGELGAVIEVGKTEPVKNWHGASKHNTTLVARNWRPSTPPWEQVSNA